MRLVVVVAFIQFSLFSGWAQSARVQVVHNCADALAAEVDIYVNGVRTIDNAPFRTASPFSDVPTGLPAIISIAPGDSVSVLDAFYTEQFSLEAGETYILIADGIVSPSGYNPAPPFSIEVYTAAREAAQNPAKVDVLVHHGSTDAPVVDVVETAEGLGNIVDDIQYTQYRGYLEVDPLDYVLEIQNAAGTNTLKIYEAQLATLGLAGNAITIIASGFLDPAQNSDGPAFGLFALSPAGGPLFPLPEIMLGVGEAASKAVAIYPNPAENELRISASQPIQSMQLYELGGKLLGSYQPGTLDGVDVSHLASGVYLIEIELVEGAVVRKKFVKR